jgi:hypothetical protein
MLTFHSFAIPSTHPPSFIPLLPFKSLLALRSSFLLSSPLLSSPYLSEPDFIRIDLTSMFVTGNVIFGHYRVVEVIVDAKNSYVIRAIDKDQEEKEEEERDVAIKMPREDLEQTNIELMILNALNHEAIIELKDAIWISNTQIHVLVLPFAHGGDLLTIVHNHGCIQEPDAKIIIFRLLSVLEYCHKNGVWQRDIKLENVLLMLRKSKSIWDVMFGDFGLAFVVNEKCDKEFLVLHSIWRMNSGLNSHIQKK